MKGAYERNPALQYLEGTMAQRDYEAWMARVNFANYGDRDPYTRGLLDGKLQEIADVREILKQACLGEWDTS